MEIKSAILLFDFFTLEILYFMRNFAISKYEVKKKIIHILNIFSKKKSRLYS